MSYVVDVLCFNFYYSVPVKYEVPLQDIDVHEGEKAVLTCEINKPDMSATWCKDGDAITHDNDKYTITVEDFTHTLVIDDCGIDDDAEYSVTIDDCTSVGNVFVEGKSCCLSYLTSLQLHVFQCAELAMFCIKSSLCSPAEAAPLLAI